MVQLLIVLTTVMVQFDQLNVFFLHPTTYMIFIPLVGSLDKRKLKVKLLTFFFSDSYDFCLSAIISMH